MDLPSSSVPGMVGEGVGFGVGLGVGKVFWWGVLATRLVGLGFSGDWFMVGVVFRGCLVFGSSLLVVSGCWVVVGCVCLGC